MRVDEFDLNRFLEAQARDYTNALDELQRGHKRSHWIWYILPQMKGLGSSAMSATYGITGLAEARAYVEHPVLGYRLTECIEAIMGHADLSAAAILGEVDALKFRSCLTLFSVAAPSKPIFSTALDTFFGGQPDLKTIRLLEDQT